ncbi:MAG: GIY-YIG nuclease family protein [Candidatus Omnitrophica bacterium]|nr:GIY-YIG nuclease family protein [Candidatus Omnitrophota bacterium]
MYYVYVLRSLKTKSKYTGFTEDCPKERLKSHNSGSSQFTRNNRPYVLVYSESFTEEAKARKRERFLKTGQGRQFLDKIIDS